MAESRKLQPNVVKKQNKTLNDLKRIYFHDGEFHLDIYKRLSTKRIEKALKDYSAIVSEVEKDKKIDVENAVLSLMFLPIVKHFTTYALNQADVKTQINHYEALVEGGYLTEILNSFDQKEIGKYFDALGNMFNISAQLLNETQKMQEVIDGLDNKDVMFGNQEEQNIQ